MEYLATDFSLLMTNKVLLKEVAKGSKFVSSPLSFHVMLSLVATGSTGNTLEQLLSFLGPKNIGDLNFLSSKIITLTSSVGGNDQNLVGGPIMSFINVAWLDQKFSLEPSFEEFVKGVYKAEVNEVDFENKADQVIEEVNSWAENATKGLTKKLLPSGSLTRDTALVLANALYFKGAWDRRFDTSKTEHRDFHLLNGQIVRVPFMTSNRYEYHLYRSYDDFTAIQIPYQSGQDTRKFSMYIFLPHEKYGLPNLIQMFNSNPGFFNQHFELLQETIPNFWIPRFKFSFEFEASKTMKEMGLELPFMGVGELTEMVNSQESDKLYVSKMCQKSFIEVNEEGTEAAAVTVCTVDLLCVRRTPSFVADHPFMFMIREETSRIVFFTGAVLNPLLDA